MHIKVMKKPTRQKTAARVEAANWQKKRSHADFPATGYADHINYEELCTNDVEYDYLLQEEYASCLIYPVNLLMENGRLVSWKWELESESPHRALDLPLLVVVRKRSEQMRGNLERQAWSVVGESGNPIPEMEWEDFDDFEVI